MEQLVILVIIGLISLVNWLMQRSAKMKENRRLEKAAEQGESPEEFIPESSYEAQEERPDESMRKLMEALGLPVQEAPPPPLPHPDPAPPIHQEPLPVARPSFRHKRLSEPPREVFAHESTKVTQPRRGPAIIELGEPSRFRTLLSTSEGIRDAFVLSEVLGKPVSMQRK